MKRVHGSASFGLALALAGAGLAAEAPPWPLALRLSQPSNDPTNRADVPAPGQLVRVDGRYAASGAQGGAVFDGLPAGAHRVTVAEWGFERFETNLMLDADTPAEPVFRLTPVAWVTVTGRVALAGAGGPLPGVRYRLRPLAVKSAVQGPMEGSTDSDGVFIWASVPTGRYRLDLEAAGCQPRTVPIEVAAGMPATALELEPVVETAALRVEVRDAASGRALPGARVTIAEALPAGVLAEAATGADGAASFDRLATAQANRMDATGRLAAARAVCAVIARADGHEPAWRPVRLGEPQTVSLALNPRAPQAAVEPNDDLNSATPILTGAPVAFSIDTPQDTEHFRFAVPSPSLVRVTATPTNGLDLWGRVFDARGGLLHEAGAGADRPLVLDLGGRRAGDYIVQLEDWSRNQASAVPIPLVVELVPAVDALEPNDTAETARLVRIGEEIRGCILPMDDLDWFRFEVTRPGWARLTSRPVPLEMYVRIYRSDGSLAAERGVGGGQGLDLACYLAPGEYRILVEEWGRNGESVNPYDLRLEFIGDDGIDDPAPDERGAPRAVRRLAPDDIAGATIFPAGDRDFYAVDLPSAGRFSAFLACPVDGYLRVFDTAGRLLAEGGAGPWRTCALSWQPSRPATVVLQVEHWGNHACSPHPYQLRTRWEPCDEGEAQVRNETREAAIPSSGYEAMRGTILPIGDRDWFVFPVDHPGVLTFRGYAPVEVWTRLFDAGGRLLAERGVGARRADQDYGLAAQVLPGDHLLEFSEWGDNDGSTEGYFVWPMLERAEPPERVPLRDDPPRPLKQGQAESFRIDHVGDRDRFLYDVAGTGAVVFSVRSADEIWVRVHDDRTGALLHESGHGGGSWHVALEASGPTRYRVELVEWGDNGRSVGPGFILADRSPRELPGEALDVRTSPFGQARRAVFLWQPSDRVPASRRVRIDADGDGRRDLDLEPGRPGSFDYRNEGVHAAVAWFEGTNDVVARMPFWVDARGAQPRRGIHIRLEGPADDATLDGPVPVIARVLSHTGEKVARVEFALDGRALPPDYDAPYAADLPWDTLGRGGHTLAVAAVDAGGARAEVRRAFRLSDYFRLSPADGAVFSGDDVRVSWIGPDFGEARVRYRPRGATNWSEAVGESGRERVVVLRGLPPGEPYEFQADGGREPGPVRTLTRVKGLAFGRARYGANIQRDYNQRVGISVRNNGDAPLTVRLECGRPADPLLLVGFVGDGSEDRPFPLKPGEEREFLLGISAQDVVTPEHRFPVRIVADTGLSDEAEVALSVKLPVVQLAWEKLGPAAFGLGERFLLRNRGDALTDLALSAEPAGDLTVSPAMSHGLLPAGGTLEVTAYPRLREGFRRLRGKVTARGVDKAFEQPVDLALPEGQRLFRVPLVPGEASDDDPESVELRDLLERRAALADHLDAASVAWTGAESPEDADLDGRIDRWSRYDAESDVRWTAEDTDADGAPDFVRGDIGDDGVCEYAALASPSGWERTNLLEAWLEMAFALPWDRSAYAKHDVEVVVNGTVVGALADTIPEGTYIFRIPPRALRFNPDGLPEGNRAMIRSRHIRGGHYVVNSDFRFHYRLASTPLWIAAATEAEAREKASAMPGLSRSEPDFCVSGAELRLEGPADPRSGQDMALEVPVRNLGAVAPETVVVALVRESAGRPPVELARVAVTNPAVAGATRVRIPWKAAGGAYTVRAVVDPDGATGDPHPANNSATVFVRVAGDDQAPTLEWLAPAAGAVLREPVARVRVKAGDEAGIARVEGSIDGGLWQPMAPESGDWQAMVLLQPGEHRLAVRAIDASGNETQTSAVLRVEAAAPEFKLIFPVDRTNLLSRSTQVLAEVPADTVLAAVRTEGGPWHKARVIGRFAQAQVPLSFGPQTVEAMVVNAAGVAAFRRTEVTSTRQPSANQRPDPAIAAPETGFVALPNLGRVDLFLGLNRLLPVPAEGGRARP